MRFDVLLSTGNYSGAMKLVSELCSHDNQYWHGVGAPQSLLLRLREAIEQSQDEELMESLEV